MMDYRVGNSVFGLLDYPSRAQEWTLERKMVELASRGYAYLEGDFAGHDPAVVRKAADANGLSLSCIRFGIRSRKDMERLVEEAAALRAEYVVVIAGFGFDSVSETVESVGTYSELAHAEGIPFLLETHRDSATQDLRRLNKLLKQLPELRLMVDLSHLVVAGEITPDLHEAHLPWVLPVLERASGFHGRITNGQQIQISLESETDEAAQAFAGLWRMGIDAWRQKQDREAFFRFTVELGPPPYALTVPDADGRRIELADRLAQGDLLARLFRQTWNGIPIRRPT